MFTSLHTMARFAVFAFAGLSLVALTTAQLHSPGESASRTLENPWEALAVETGEGRGKIQLVDRVSGKTRVVSTPSSERWDLLTTSPMMSEDGSMTVVGRYSAPLDGDASASDRTVGIVRVRLPKGEVLERLEMEFVPTGRAAWDPSGAPHLIFPGATGGLYSYRFSRDNPSEPSTITRLQWRCDPPGGREPFMVDPVRPRDPQLRDLVIVSLARAKRLGESGPDLPLTPWWLVLDPDCEAIVAAGPLFDPGDPIMTSPRGRARFPNVARRDGRLELIYLWHTPGKTAGTLCSAELEVGEGPNRLRVRPGTAGPACDAPVAFGVMLPTLDARLAFTVPAMGRDAVRLSLDRRPSDAAAQ